MQHDWAGSHSRCVLRKHPGSCGAGSLSGCSRACPASTLCILYNIQISIWGYNVLTVGQLAFFRGSEPWQNKATPVSYATQRWQSPHFQSITERSTIQCVRESHKGGGNKMHQPLLKLSRLCCIPYWKTLNTLPWLLEQSTKNGAGEAQRLDNRTQTLHRTPHIPWFWMLQVQDEVLKPLLGLLCFFSSCLLQVFLVLLSGS